MEKIAQKRGLLNKLREKTNITGIAAEKYFSPELTQVMEILRKNDNAIRATIAGEAIEGESPALEGPGLKETLKKAKSNFNRREYLLAIYDLSDFHKKAAAVNTIISDLNLKIDQIHYKFFIEDDDASRELLQKHKEELAERFTQKKAALIRQATLTQHDANIKQAGIKDFLHNIGTQRGRALAYWEKKNPKEIKNLKDKTEKIINESQTFLDASLKMLEDMASARATRSPGDYQNLSKELAKVYYKYHVKFQEYYENTVKSFLEKIEALMPQKEIKAIEEAVDPAQESVVVPAPVEKPAPVSEPVVIEPPAASLGPVVAPEPEKFRIADPSTTQSVPAASPSPQSGKFESFFSNLPANQQSLLSGAEFLSSNKGQTLQDSKPEIYGKIKIKIFDYLDVKEKFVNDAATNSELIDSASQLMAEYNAVKDNPNTIQASFIHLLESLSNESPAIIASVIKKYANTIKKSNPVAATKLLKIASKI